jgi:two-component system, NtrC family, sensor kinase
MTKRKKTLRKTPAKASAVRKRSRSTTHVRKQTSEIVKVRRGLAEARAQQTATASVLRSISQSTFDLQGVLDSLVKSAAGLCEADRAVLIRKRGEDFYRAALHGFPNEAVAEMKNAPVDLTSGVVGARALRECAIVHVADVNADPDYPGTAAQALGGVRTVLSVPLVRENEPIGAFTVSRTHVEPFSESHVALIKIFADQAVIAIENVRLFEEVQAKTRDLEESLQQQTATAGVLKVISRSTFDLQTVLDTLVESAARLCEADIGHIARPNEAGYFQTQAHWGWTAELTEEMKRIPFKPGRASVAGRALQERRTVQILDAQTDPEYELSKAQRLGGYRSMIGTPLLRDGIPIGVFGLARHSVRAFTDKQMTLLTTFADQAVIAIENTRLFEELRERQAELRVTFDNMGDGVVMFDAAARLTAWNRNFQEMLELPDAFLAKRPSFAEYFRYLADRGEYVSAELETQLSRSIADTRKEMRFERTRPDGRVIEVRRNPVPGGGFVLIYSEITERKRAEEAIKAARDAAESALRELQMAQASLVHAQKMAALGQLTAGIAHEIKNPLNFVNNFASLSVELLDELKDAAARALGALDPGKRTEIIETIGTLTGNLERIVEHGRRADGIVRSMLQHSRGSSGDWQATDLNTLVEEALNLAYHGARAQDPNFAIALERDLDPDLAPIDVVPQELTRVLLNLIGNGFYAANKGNREGDGTFRPALKVTTCELGDGVEVRVRDNGIGIPPEDRDKLFQPFFTTKPTGEGTGLGLSISYEIVTQQHGGTITVDSEPGDFTEFTVRLPRRPRAVAGGTG